MDVAQILQLVFAGGVGGILLALTQYIRARGQNRVEAKAQQDEYSIKFRAALDADEETFRKALWEMVGALRQELTDERTARRELDARLTETQKALTLVTLERDEVRREHERERLERERLRTELDQAHKKIRALELELAALKQQQETHL